MALIKILAEGHKEHLRQNDIDLTRHVLKLLGLFVEKGKDLAFDNIRIIPDFLAVNEDVDLHVEATICLKNYIKLAPGSIIKK